MTPINDLSRHLPDMRPAPSAGFCVSRLYSSPWRTNQHTPSATVNGRLAIVNRPIPETDSAPVNDPLTIRLEAIPLM
jgi:hypothetical protein